MRKIPVASPVFAGNEKKYVEDCMEKSWLSFGDYNRRFERAFAEFCGTKFAVSCNNGTAALHLALLSLGIGPGDEVIVPTLTFISTPNAVSYCGATPIFVDSEPVTGNIDVEKIEEKITPRTKAILPVHLYGQPCDMGAIEDIAARHGNGLFVVEDAAEAHGAEWMGYKVGSLGDIGVFSFFANKIITAGEGGMVVMHDERLAARVRQYMGMGQSFDRRYWFPVIGYNYRMTNIQAAIGLAQLEKIDWHIEKRRQVERWYRELLQDTSHLILPTFKSYASPVCWMFNIILEEDAPIGRDRMMKVLGEAGVGTRPFFPPCHIQPPYDTGERLPVAEKLALRGLNLPTSAGLAYEDVEYVANQVKRSLR